MTDRRRHRVARVIFPSLMRSALSGIVFRVGAIIGRAQTIEYAPMVLLPLGTITLRRLVAFRTSMFEERGHDRFRRGAGKSGPFAGVAVSGGAAGGQEDVGDFRRAGSR